MDEPRVAVEGEDDRLVGCEQRSRTPYSTCHAGARVVGCSRIRSTTFTTRTFKSGSCSRRIVPPRASRASGTSPQHARTTSASEPSSLRGPRPHADAPRAVDDRLVHRQPVQRRLFAGDDHVHIVPAPQAVICDRKKGVGVREEGRRVRCAAFLLTTMIDEPGILVRKAIVVLAPHVRAQQVVERGNRLAPRESRCDNFSHLACWLNIESTMWMKAS